VILPSDFHASSMGGQQAKRRRALVRAGLAPEVAAKQAAKEFAEAGSEPQELEDAKKGDKTERQKAREKRKRLEKRSREAADAAAGKKPEQPVSEKTHKRKSKEVVDEDAEGPNKKIKGNKYLTVFVGQLPFTVDARALEEHFVKAGIEDVVSVRMLTEKATKKSRGMAFVQLASEEDVVSALTLNQSELSGRWINVERSTRGATKEERVNRELMKGDGGIDEKPKDDHSLSVFVAKLPYTADEKSIREHFENGGVKGVVKVRMLSERGTNRKGMAFVQLSDEDGVTAALELNESEIGNRYIVVERSSKGEAKEKAAAVTEKEEQKKHRKATEADQEEKVDEEEEDTDKKEKEQEEEEDDDDEDEEADEK